MHNTWLQSLTAWLLLASMRANCATSSAESAPDFSLKLPSQVTQWFLLQQAVQSAVEPVVSDLGRLLQDVQHSQNASEVAEEVRATQLASKLGNIEARQNATAEDVASLAALVTEVRSRMMTQPVRDCSDLPAESPSGVYFVSPGLGRPVPAYCDQDTDGGGWTVFQRRADIKPRQNFYLNWDHYKWGFGELEAEFWWGLENIWLMTTPLDRRYELRIDLEDFDGSSRYATYKKFRISSEAEGYRLAATSYSGDAGDSLSRHYGSKFSTKDRDQDVFSSSCAQSYKGAWWYKDCHDSNLNGQYLSGEHSSHANGVNWKHWRGHKYSLKNVEMKMRPMPK